jgi:hypothetical protein
MKRMSLIAGVMAGVVVAAAPASAKLALNTIDDTATMSAGGRVVRVSGPIGCSAAERASIRVTVTQRATATVAEGRWTGTCSRRSRTWTARQVRVRGAGAFRAGRAEACALGVTRKAGDATDAKQWCEVVTLVAGG